MTEEGEEFFPLYVRPSLSPAAIIGWFCALAAAIVAFAWIVVQFNDAHYEGVIETTCEWVWNEGHTTVVGRELVIITREREGIRRRIVIQADCSMNP